MPKRGKVYQAEAVVLRRRNLGEADRLLTVYSLEFGKIQQIAKGVRRPKSRKAGHLEPFTRVRLLAARGRELDIITQAEAVENFPKIRTDLARLGLAAYFVELLDAFTVEHDDNRELYRLLVETLELLESQGEHPALKRFYELRVLDIAGYRPELFNCRSCDSEIKPEDQHFSPAQGGVVCPSCGPRERASHPISLSALKVLRHFQRNTYPTAAAASIREEVHRELDQIMESFISFLLERKLNSPNFIQRIRRLSRKTQVVADILEE